MTRLDRQTYRTAAGWVHYGKPAAGGYVVLLCTGKMATATRTAAAAQCPRCMEKRAAQRGPLAKEPARG